MMTLDQAIKHCEEKAEEKQKDYERACAYNISSEGCLECAEEHRQLAEWLKELKRVREQPWLKELKRLREQTRWIPCSERLPEDHHLYLATIKKANGITFTAQSYFFTKEVGWSDACVTAWMPFPEPYKAENEPQESEEV